VTPRPAKFRMSSTGQEDYIEHKLEISINRIENIYIIFFNLFTHKKYNADKSHQERRQEKNMVDWL
jgi:hypothetical protein